MTSEGSAAYVERLERAREELVSRGLEAAVITRPENIFFLTGYRAAGIAAATAKLHALLLPAEGEPSMLVRSLERRTSEAMVSVDRLVYDDAEDPFALLAERMAEIVRGPGAPVGVELQRISAYRLQRLLDRLDESGSGVLPVDVSGLIEAHSLILGTPEIASMRRAAQVSAAGLRTGLAASGPGVAAADVVGQVQAAMYAAGQTDFEKSFVALWSGPHGGLMHDTRLDRTLASGDVATVEVMGVDNHYIACAQATVPVGNAPDGFAAVQDLVHSLHDAARAAVRPGARAGDVFAAASRIYEQETGTPYFRRAGDRWASRRSVWTSSRATTRSFRSALRC
ncbi:M24 family metallopeptidase [Blastococcus brunescens]|uniref:M24 family metallopeptidase n=1 Tax=Blastococcus brunescens TaxID=1564165 RepID=A0ABZ1AYF7_9ACTN|nr:M24 family metallopeptidase [Blastococcus sp. BMG 8361]WRL63597.1 M24 family metallopeptidase [Blastococcus sp. BMG 8361]